MALLVCSDTVMESKTADRTGSGKATASLPWIEKYRPNSLDDLIAHDHIIGTSACRRSTLRRGARARAHACAAGGPGVCITPCSHMCGVVARVPRAVNRLIDANKLPHLLLYGPPGTGKTSTIVACAKRLYGKKWKSMTLEVRRGGTLAGGTPCSALRCCVQFRSRQPWSPVPCAASQLNASDDRGIGVVRDQIKSFAGTMKLFSKGVKLVILDEADAMTSDAQFALRRGAYTPCRVPPTLP